MARRRWSRSAVTGERVYVTNSLYRSWDEQFYPDGIRDGWRSWTRGRTAASRSTAELPVETSTDMRPHQVQPRRRRRVFRFVLLRVRCVMTIRDDSRTVPSASANVDVGGAARARRVSRHQSRNGLAVCGGARDAGAPPRGGVARDGAAGVRSCAGDCRRARPRDAASVS